ncbi:MAG: DUF86 domain-containing protein [Oscillospiraceae bacterium]|nr:DUF86 domain-containing protein [Oscillospiraceae bacterium]
MNADQVRILKIEGHVKLLLGYMQLCENYDNFIGNEPICSASVLHLLQVGELSNSLSSEFRLRYPNIPWKSIIGLRNIIAHRYGDLNYSRIWEIMESELPDFFAWLNTRPS